MKSTAEHPLAFFDWYLENKIDKDLKEFYNEITKKLYYNNVIEIFEDNHSIKVLNIYHQDLTESKHITLSFEGSIKGQLTEEINITKKFIELGFQKRFSDRKEVKAYADFLTIKLNQLLKNNNLYQFNFIPKYLGQISDLITHFSTEQNKAIELNSEKENNQSQTNSSFSVKSNFKKGVFTELYTIAEEHGVIDYEKISEDTFIKTLTESSDNKSSIVFSCNNSMMIQFLLDIQPLFNNFKAKDIQESQNLITKQGKPITIEIYDTSKQRQKISSKISAMSEQIKDLLQKV